nr:hypothetical protein BaRGS_025120 [Batillaria attramentaria]
MQTEGRQDQFKLLPRGGVAAQMSCCSGSSQKTVPKTEDCLAFCMLPLPVQTGLPVHVNGHFALDQEARRGLWDNEGDARTKWNKAIVLQVSGQLTFFEKIEDTLKRPVASKFLHLLSGSPDMFLHERVYGYFLPVPEKIGEMVQEMNIDMLARMLPATVSVMTDLYTYLYEHLRALDLSKLKQLPLICDTDNKQMLVAQNVIIHISDEDIITGLDYVFSVGEHVGFELCDPQVSAVDTEDNDPCYIYAVWHPDKNLGNEAFCTRVTQTIQRYVQLLEQGRSLDDEEADDEVDGSGFPSSFSRFFTRMDERSRAHRDDYEENARDWGARQGGSSYSRDED